MRHAGLTEFLARKATGAGGALAKGPVALIFVEDEVETASTVDHHLRAGFSAVVLFAPDGTVLPDPLPPMVHAVPCDTRADGAVFATVNAVIDAAPGIWFYYGYNAEYLLYPFCETRNVRELIAFHAEERRDAMLTYVVDLYAGDLARAPLGVDTADAMIDKAGYYALVRKAADGQTLDRQLDFHGGLRWRFEEHVPKGRRRIDRIALFRAREGLRLRPDHTFSVEEYNTYACPWHHNLTAAVCSFRTAKALKSNPGSTFDIPTFRWHNSVPFAWTSRQMMDLGLMEPGQWF